MQRQISHEWLDDDRGTPEEIVQSLDDLWRINRWLGGVSSGLRLFENYFARFGRHAIQALDVGAGDARLSACLKEKLRRRKLQVEFTVLERRITHLNQARTREAGLRAVVGDVFAPPFAEGAFDVVMCNLFFHHFSGGSAVRLLKSLMRLARESVLISDLERSAVAHTFIRGAWPFARSPITRHDGPASVRQAYTRPEAQTLVEEAGFRNYEIVQMWPYRMGLILWK
jgi:ubiquinone/menaquinone biosynthesis C-methylase UbiE